MVNRRVRKGLVALGAGLGAVLVALVLTSAAPAGDDDRGRSVHGAGTTIVEGGTGPTTFEEAR